MLWRELFSELSASQYSLAYLGTYYVVAPMDV